MGSKAGVTAAPAACPGSTADRACVSRAESGVVLPLRPGVRAVSRRVAMLACVSSARARLRSGRARGVGRGGLGVRPGPGQGEGVGAGGDAVLGGDGEGYLIAAHGQGHGGAGLAAGNLAPAEAHAGAGVADGGGEGDRIHRVGQAGLVVGIVRGERRGRG